MNSEVDSLYLLQHVHLNSKVSNLCKFITIFDWIIKVLTFYFANYSALHRDKDMPTFRGASKNFHIINPYKQDLSENQVNQLLHLNIQELR